MTPPLSPASGTANSGALIHLEGSLPLKGEVYRHERLRGEWTVQSCGPKWITLTPSIPYLGVQRIPTEGFMQANWERVR